jgi:hypothetical protein
VLSLYALALFLHIKNNLDAKMVKLVSEQGLLRLQKRRPEL